MLTFVNKYWYMQIDYKFSSDVEPTDEQLHLLMKEVVEEVINKATKTNILFWENLSQLVKKTHEKGLTFNSDAK